MLNDLREGVAHGLAGAQIVFRFAQCGGPVPFVRLERAHGQFGEHARGGVGPEDGGGRRRRFHPSQFHPKVPTAFSKKFRPRINDRSLEYMKRP